MKNAKLTSLICGSVLSLGSAAFAQQGSTLNPNTGTLPSSGAGNSSASQGTLNRDRLGSSLPSDRSSSSTLGSSSGADARSMRSDQNVRLSQILNNSVRSQEGKTLGFIRDLTVDPQSGTIQFAILSLTSSGAATDTSTSGRETVPSSRSSTVGTPSIATGGTMSGKLVPVPWQLFNAGNTTPGAQLTGLHQPNLVLNIDESKLRTAPSFDSSNWNDLQGGTIGQQVYSHFGVDQSSATGNPGSSISGQGTSGTAIPNSSGTAPNSSSTIDQGRSGDSRLPDSSAPGATRPQR